MKQTRESYYKHLFTHGFLKVCFVGVLTIIGILAVICGIVGFFYIIWALNQN